jgi:hypothetical protein
MADPETGDVSARSRGIVLLVLALIASAALVSASLARGGYDRGRVTLANPCSARPSIEAGGTTGTVEQIALDGLDGAACHLGISRERLVVGLASDEGRDRLFGSGHAEDDRVESAVRAGLRRSIDAAAARGSIGGLELRLLRAATDHLPVSELMRGYQAIS